MQSGRGMTKNARCQIITAYHKRGVLFAGELVGDEDGAVTQGTLGFGIDISPKSSGDCQHPNPDRASRSSMKDLQIIGRHSSQFTRVVLEFAHE
jgi:hypothetical protein